MPYAFEAVVEGDNDNNNDNNNNNNGTNQGSVGMPDQILTWLIVITCLIVVILLLIVGVFIGMILIAMKKSESNVVYSPYPPFYPNNGGGDEYEDDDDEDDEDETYGSGREGEASGRESNDSDDKEGARRNDEIVAAESESGRYVSDGAVVISGSERLDIKDSILLLSDEEKRYIFGLRDYAIERSGEKASFAKYHLTVGKGTKQVVKLSVKDGEVMAYFRIEDERLRTIRRNARENDAEIKIKETEIAVDGESAYEMAKDLIDLRITQIEENLEYRKQLLKEKRKAKREQDKNAENIVDGDNA